MPPWLLFLGIQVPLFSKPSWCNSSWQAQGGCGNHRIPQNQIHRNKEKPIWALKSKSLNFNVVQKKTYLSMYGKVILCGISKGTFEIPHKISYPCIERCRLYSQVKIKELLDLRAHNSFLNAPLDSNPRNGWQHALPPLCVSSELS